MLAVWAALTTANLLFAVTFPAKYKPPKAVTGTCLALGVGMTVLLLALGRLMPLWLVWVLFAAGVAATLWMSWDALTLLGPVLFVLPTVVFTMYVALFAPRWATFAFLGVLAAAVLALFAAKGMLPYLTVSWLVLMSISAALAILLTYLVRSLRTLATTDPVTGLLNRRGDEFLLILPATPPPDAESLVAPFGPSGAVVVRHCRVDSRVDLRRRLRPGRCPHVRAEAARGCTVEGFDVLRPRAAAACAHPPAAARSARLATR